MFLEIIKCCHWVNTSLNIYRTLRVFTDPLALSNFALTVYNDNCQCVSEFLILAIPCLKPPQSNVDCKLYL